MEELQRKQRSKALRICFICNWISIVLLLLCRLFWEYCEPLAERFEKSPLITVWAILYFLIIVFMIAFRLAYLHLALQICFVLLAVYNLIKDRNMIQFLLSLFLAVIAVALDISWLQAQLH